MIIDIHVHYYKKWCGMVGLKITDLIAKMDKSGIDMSILNSLSALTEKDPSPGNKEIYNAVSLYPDRLVGMASVNPYHAQYAEEELKRCLSTYEFKGLKLHPWIQGYPAHSEIVHNLIDICKEYNVPILFHSGTPPYTQVVQIAYIAKKFPDVVFILGHMGLTYQWKEAIEVATMYQNIFLETSGITYSFAIKEAIKKLGTGRIVFGTDSPFLESAELEIMKIKNLKLSSDQWEMIMYKNAKELFNLNQSKKLNGGKSG